MQKLCALAGVFIVVTFSAGADAALISMDEPGSRPSAPPGAGYPPSLQAPNTVATASAPGAFAQSAGADAQRADPHAERQLAYYPVTAQPRGLLADFDRSAGADGANKNSGERWLGSAVASVPEASTPGLLLTGLGLLWLLRRRNKLLLGRHPMLQDQPKGAIAPGPTAGVGAQLLPRPLAIKTLQPQRDRRINLVSRA